MLLIKPIDGIQNDVCHHRVRSDRARVIEFTVAKLVGIVPKDILLARRSGILALDSKQHRNVLVTVQAVRNEERDDNYISLSGQVRPLGYLRWLFHKGGNNL